MKDTIYRLLSLSNDLRAARKGPEALGKRLIRKEAYKMLSRVLRRSGL